MALVPLEDRIIVKQHAAQEVTSGGLVIPEAAREAPRRGVVLAVGPGGVLDSGATAPMPVEEGDVVVYSKYGGTEVELDGEQVLILSVRDVLAIVAE